MFSESMYQLGAKRSCIRELFEYGLRQAKIVGPENVFDFAIGNPSIPSPPAVGEAFTSLLTQEDPLTLHGYTPAPGCDEARQAVAEDLTARSGMTIRPENLFLTCGAAPALISVIRALAVDEAEVLAFAPFFPEYRPFVESCGARFRVVPADRETFLLPVGELESYLTSHTQALIINSPNNPSGVIYPRENLQALSELLARKSREYGHPIYVISDEPYRELVYDGATVPFLPAIYPNTVICYSWSKSLSLPGERIGYVCVPDCVADSEALFAAVAGAARVTGHVCAPSLQQRVVALCTTRKPDLEAYDRNRRDLYDGLTEMGYRCVRPQGAFYLFVQAPGGSAQAFSDRAKEKNLLVVPGDDFGCPDYFRLSTCVAHETIVGSLPIFRELIAEF